MKFKLILAGTALFASTTVFAGPAEGAWIMGMGANTCGKLVTADRLKNEVTVQMAVAWAQGFMSATNSLADKQAKNLKVDADTIRAYLVKRCNEKPLDDINQAVMALANELYTKP